MASVCLQIGYPSQASVPHSIINGFKRVLAVACATEIDFKEAQQVCSHSALWKLLNGIKLLTVLCLSDLCVCMNVSTVCFVQCLSFSLVL